MLTAATVLLAGGVAMAVPELPQDRRDAIRKTAEELGGRARNQIKPMPQGQTKVLQAVVMKVTGRAQWRADAKSPWRVAKVDDLLSPGATLRTGRRSTIMLRVGHNATVLVDRHTRMIVPEVVQVGETLRTKAYLKYGRADFKVDRVGLTNDFTVVTPSTTLAVRGTAFSVQYGGFGGTQVGGARTNVMHAVEISYFLSRYSYYLSGQASSSDEHKNPAIQALFLTFGPPPALSGLVEDETLPELLDGTFGRNPVLVAHRVGISIRGMEHTQEELPGQEQEQEQEMDPPVDEPPMNPYDPFDLAFFGNMSANQITTFICESLFSIFIRYDDNLVAAFGVQQGFRTGSKQGLRTGSKQGFRSGFKFPGLDQVFFDVGFICNDPGDEGLDRILDIVEAYCADHFSHEADFDICIDSFDLALFHEFHHQRE